MKEGKTDCDLASLSVRMLRTIFLSNAYRAELERLVSDFSAEAPLWVAVTSG